ncbi:MAG TPA: sporulation initiation factor Spo0A C-terminal domain-containing protein [Ruminococcus sp.]|nr:sporulation initiation factor Spo0A C-terminal domain-containing protein [Ruminococcus sp.]
MSFKLLVCTLQLSNCTHFKKYISAYDAEVSFCENDGSQIRYALSETSYDAVFIFTDSRTDLYSELIGDIHSLYPELKIFAGCLCCSAASAGRLRSAGADLCIFFPTGIKRAAALIAAYMKFCNYERIPLDIACYLSNHGFSTKNTGFIYLCNAAEICINEPESLNALYEKVYGRIADRFGVQLKLTERMIRLTASAAVADGTIPSFIGQQVEKMISHDLIAAICDNFERERYCFI